MPETSSSLVKGIADFRDHNSWVEFDASYRAMIKKVLVTKGTPTADLDDAVQEVYVSLLSTIQKFQYDRSKGKFRSWISKITQRTASNQRRKTKYLDTLEIDPDSEAADVNLDVPEIRLCVQMARSRFDERTWLPFYLRVIEDTPIEEVERITGMNRNAIYQAVHRVKTCLRDMLEQLD